MPAIGYPYNFLRGMSDFWQRFFADADQLEALYKGTAIQIGQAYLDYMSAVLGVSLRDAVALDREYYKMIALREDEIAFEEGVSAPANRWAFKLPDGVVNFASLDNRVFEPTTSLEPAIDYEIVDGAVKFHADPTDTGAGLPIAGYARRQTDVTVGGKFTDATVASWITALVKKGDTLRVLDVGTDGTQRRRADYALRVVRADALYVDASTPFPTTPTPPPTTGIKYVILRVPSSPSVTAENFTTVAFAATLAHTRLDVGSVRVFAKAPGGEDVVEDVDYTVNYEHGKIIALTVWQGMSGGGAGTFAVDYTWRKEVVPSVGLSPRLATTGVISTSSTTTRVIEMTAWAPDARVDRRTLANNFGSLIGRQGDSSEPYRAFLEGIFQLYVLGPVLERIESALNVVLNLPVVRDDGEIYQSTDTSDPLVDRVLTTRPLTGQTATYEFPKGTPLRPDLVAGLELLSFEPLTTAVVVTDYVQTPQWWYGEVIPRELFSGAPPSVSRRTASQAFVNHVIGAADAPEIGDPGLFIGAAEDGDPSIFPPGHPVFRHRMAFVLMDRYMKVHTFSVKFDATAISAALGSSFVQSLLDLNELVLSAKPSHTYVFTTPGTALRDEIEITEDTLEFGYTIGSGGFGADRVIFSDDEPPIGTTIWTLGDYWKYEFFTVLTAFPAIGVPVTLANAPVAPRHGRLVFVYPAGTIGGKRLIENIDYSVNYATRQVTRLTAWAVTTVNVTYRQLNIGNVVDAPAGAGDMLLTLSNVDPSYVTAAFNATAPGWDGVNNPPTAARDMGMVERALVVNPH
jgi:hypothetical protein